MSLNIDGVYLAYFTGEFGTSIGVFLVHDHTIQGGDVGAGIYDGTFTVDGQKAKGTMAFKMLGEGTTITGATNDLPVSYDTKFEFDLPLEDSDYHRLETLGGPVNVRFTKVRSI